MSFSADVKKELLEVVPAARHCQIAETAAFVRLLASPGSDKEAAGKSPLVFRTDSPGTARKFFTLLKKAFNIDIVVSETGSGSRRTEILTVGDEADAARVRQAVSHHSVLRMDCCRRAFLRGAFLASGSVSNPEKSYHLEIVCAAQDNASLIMDTMRKSGLDAKTVLRKGDYVVYLKEGDQIVQLLGEMGASISFLNIENVRVLKEMRGSVNRKVNCETANLKKTVVSAVRQTDDIQYIKDHGGIGQLADPLREMAEIRIRYPDASLTELGMYLNPRLGKSGVNHRLRKISACAEELRRKNGGDSGDPDS